MITEIIYEIHLGKNIEDVKQFFHILKKLTFFVKKFKKDTHWCLSSRVAFLYYLETSKRFCHSVR